MQKLLLQLKEKLNYLYNLLYQTFFSVFKKLKFKSPRKFNANNIIKIPATILSSLEKNNNTFPTAEAAAPRVIKTNEKPNEKIIVFKRTTFYIFFQFW